MPTVPPEPATKTDLAEVRDELKSDITGVRDELKAVRTELKSDITALRTELATFRAEVGEGFASVVAMLRAEVRAELQVFRVDLEASVSRQIAASAEETRGWFRALADKLDVMNSNHRELATDHAQLRAACEAHRDDTAVHRVRRARRSRAFR